MKILRQISNKITSGQFFQMKQKAEITFEIEETIILRQGGANRLEAFCPQCQSLVEMITPPIAAALFGLSEREIFRLIESGRIHFAEVERVFVCRGSLMNRSLPQASATELLNDER